MSVNMSECEWCRTPIPKTNDAFCSEACRSEWLDWDRQLEYAHEAALDAAYEEIERERQDAWEELSDDERSEAWAESETAPW